MKTNEVKLKKLSIKTKKKMKNRRMNDQNWHVIRHWWMNINFVYFCLILRFENDFVLRSIWRNERYVNMTFVIFMLCYARFFIFFDRRVFEIECVRSYFSMNFMFSIILLMNRHLLCSNSYFNHFIKYWVTLMFSNFLIRRFKNFSIS